MIHIRTDAGGDRGSRTFACGIGPELPEGDKWLSNPHPMVDCPACAESCQLGIPISEISGRPGHRGYDKFVELANSWGYP